MSEQNTAIKTAENTSTMYTVDYILSKIVEIQTETVYLNEALSKLSTMSDGDSGDCGSPGNMLGAEKAKAFGDIVRCRETTNQHMLRIYEKLLDNLISENK